MDFLNFEKIIKHNEEIFSPHLLVRSRWGLLIILALVLLIFVEMTAISFRQFSIAIILLSITIVMNNFQESMIQKDENQKLIGNFWQLLIDLALVSTILFLTGGSRNPFGFILILPVFYAPLFLTIGKSISILSLTILSLYLQKYSYFQFLHSWDFLEFNITTGIVIISGLWASMTWLSFIISKTRDYIEEVARREMRISRLHAVGALTSGFCHELGTPMGTMRMRVDRLLSGRGGDEDYKVIDECLAECEVALKSMVGQSQNNDKLNFEPNKLKELIETSVEVLMKPEKVNIEISCNDDLEIIGSRVSLLRLFHDLMENSVQANSTEIVVSCLKQGKYIEVEVKDNGDGFPESVLKNFGTPFNSTKKGGMGIGLYNALVYMDLLGGRINISNDKGAKVAMLFES